MIAFFSALAAFVVAHMVPAMPPVRARLVALLGRRGYLILYSAVSLALLAWVVVAARQAEPVALWNPGAWQWVFAALVMPLSFALLATGLAEANPLSVSLRSGDRPGPAAAITRHPVLWGFLLWAVGHIPANGRLVSLVLFGTMAAMAALGMPLLDRKAKRRLGHARWQSLAGATSIVPFAALLAGRARLRPTGGFLAAAALGLVLYAWMLLQGHALLIGPDPWQGVRAAF